MTDDTSAINFFSFDPAGIHSTTPDGKQWFLASDVFSELGIDLQGSNAADYLNAQCEEAEANQRLVLEDGVPVALVSDYILCSLILKSDNPQAKHFQKSVTPAVLKGIHRDGKNILLALPS